MSFTARHYRAIATVMQHARHYHLGNTVVCNNLADLFAADNSKFKRDLFIAACEPGANVNARTVAGAARSIEANEYNRELKLRLRDANGGRLPPSRITCE